MQSEMVASPAWIHCGLKALSNKHICWLVFVAMNHKVTSTSKHCDVKCKANIIQRSLPFCTGYPRAFLFRAIIHPCKNPIKKMTMKRLESEGRANCVKAKQMSAMTTYTESKIPVLFSLPYLWVSFRHWYCNSRRKLFLSRHLSWWNTKLRPKWQQRYSLWSAAFWSVGFYVTYAYRNFPSWRCDMNPGNDHNSETFYREVNSCGCICLVFTFVTQYHDAVCKVNNIKEEVT